MPENIRVWPFLGARITLFLLTLITWHRIQYLQYKTILTLFMIYDNYSIITIYAYYTCSTNKYTTYNI